MRINSGSEQDLRRKLRIPGLIVWVLVGLPVLLRVGPTNPRFPAWCLAFALFGLAWLVGTVRGLSRRTSVAASVLQSGAVVGMVATLCNGYEGVLLVSVLLQLLPVIPLRAAVFWMGAQTLAFGAAIAWHWSPGPALSLSLPYLGVQALTLWVGALLIDERRLRRDLDMSHAELLALQPRLADAARDAERVRMARELHDAAGHQLTALSLNLEVAAHLTDGRAREHVRLAQTLGRSLLDDLHRLVEAYARGPEAPLGQAMRELLAGFPRPAVHLDVPSSLRFDDPSLNHVLLRCAQEVLTNCARHSGAENLWLSVREENAAMVLNARDDGKGADNLRAGQGLTGMAARLSDVGGALDVSTQAGNGFRLTARIPLRGTRE